MHYVYIIRSVQKGLYYKGYSTRPYERLNEHNQGKSRYTAKYVPWELVCLLEFSTKKEALIKERKLKKYPSKSLEALISSNQNRLNEK